MSRTVRVALAAAVAACALAPVAASAQEPDPPPGRCWVEWQPAPEPTSEPLPVTLYTPYVKCIF